MCIRDRCGIVGWLTATGFAAEPAESLVRAMARQLHHRGPCLLYTSDAADERSSVALGGRRILKKKTNRDLTSDLKNYKEQPRLKAADQTLD